MSLERSMALLGSYYYVPHLVLVALYMVLQLLPDPRPRRPSPSSGVSPSPSFLSATTAGGNSCGISVAATSAGNTTVVAETKKKV
jgi:hypothetical protein